MKYRKHSIEQHIGKKYTHLTIIGKAIQDKPGYKKAVVKCDCGRYEIKLLHQILAGITRTCGKCNLRYKLPFLIGKTELTDNIQFKLVKIAYQEKKTDAKRRNLFFDLSLDFFKEMILRSCESCGDIGTSHKTRPIKGDLYTLYYNGIDRIDNKKGYTIDNIATLCKYCNRMKNDLMIKELVRRAKGLAKLGKVLLAEGK